MATKPGQTLESRLPLFSVWPQRIVALLDYVGTPFIVFFPSLILFFDPTLPPPRSVL